MSAPGSRLASWLFLRCVGLVYLVAFVSLWVQIEGLLGRDGILPAANYLARAAEVLGGERYHRLPTLLWLDSSDAALHGLCALGAAASLLLIAGLGPRFVLVALWALYLSLVAVGREFLAFQWDTLLLEAGFFAVFLAPGGVRPRSPFRSACTPTSAVGAWLLRALLFKLILESGVAKLASGDAAWRSLTALTVHYETQPLPTWIGWYVHQLPEGVHVLSAVVMFAIELGCPWLIFARRPGPVVAAGGIAFLQVLLVLTGNYAFFNWLTLALCLPLLDDATIARAIPGRWRGRVLEPHKPPPTVAGHSSRVAAVRLLPASITVALFVIVSGASFARLFVPTRELPRVVLRLLEASAPFRTLNRYGLFAVMTTSRPEIVIEGSEDSQVWREYAFRWKPGDVRKRPGFVAPHQPRLDWQMWFAALGNYRENPCLVRCMERILRGERDVLALLASDPFPDRPPRFVRAVLYDYRFSDSKTRKGTRAWWVRERKGLYAPPITREAVQPDERS